MAIALNARVGLSNVIVGLESPKVGFSKLALGFPRTEGDVKSKCARFICSSSFLGHVEVKSQRRHCN